MGTAGGEGHDDRERLRGGEREFGEVEGVKTGLFESLVSLSAPFWPSSLCVPFSKGGGEEEVDEARPLEDKELWRVSSCWRSLIFIVFLALKIFFFSSATATSIFT